MESERTWSVEMLRGEKEDNEAVLSEGLEELEFSVTDDGEVDEEEQGSTPLIDACRENMSEMVSLLLTAKADVTLCDCSRLTALQACPLQLREKALSWMSRPDLPLQTELLQAAWQGDLHSVQTLLTVGVDVNVANADGATPVMLAVRDVDLFEGIAALLPREHRPVAVLRKLLGLSVDLWVRDHCGRSALDYAANIRSPLREDIWKMMFEAANHADGAHTSLLDLEEHFNQDLASKFGGSDVQLDVEIFNNRSPATSPMHTPNQQQHVLLYSQSEMSSWLAAGEEQVVYEKTLTFQRLADTTPCDIQEVLESQGHSRADINQGQSVSGEQERSDSVLRQGLEMGAPGTTSSGTDKGIPLHFQNTMETPRGIRQSNQDTRRGSRGGLCLPSLSSSHLDPSTSPGLLTTRTSCLPAPPKHGQRRKILAASSVSSTRLLTVAQSGQLSQSAPSIMEPLLGPHSGIHARANRLGCEDTGNKQKHILPALSPKLLEPVNKRPEEHAVLPVLRHHPPLKFISNIPLSSWTRPRTERRWGRLRTGPLATKGGSEESGSSSSSLDLEDEGDSEGDVHGKVSGGSHLMFARDGGLQRLNDKSPPGDDLVQMTVRNIPLNHRSAHSGKPVSASRLSPEQAPDYQCRGKNSNPRQPAHRQTFRRSTDERGETVNFNALVTSECEEVKSNAGQTPETEISHGEIHETQGEPDECCEGNLRCDLLAKQDFQVENSTSHREDVKLQTEEKLPSSNLSESNMGVSEDSRKVASGKERRMRTACSQRSNPRTNQRSFNSQTRHDPSNSHSTKSKSSLSYSHSDSQQNKDKNSKSPSIHCEISSPIPRKKGSEKTRRLKVKVSSNRVQQLPALRELKDSHLLKKPSFAGITRSKSAVDVITYNDMFQQIQNGDGGPAIYEMFAGPLYDNLRASSSCDQVQDRKVQSATATCRPLKHTHMRTSPAGQAERTAVSANDRPKHGSSRQKNITSASCKKTQKIKSTTKHDGHEKAESAVPKGPGNCHAQEKGKDEMLSTIEESATLKSDIRTLTSGAGSSRNLPLPDPTFHQSPERLKSNTWEPSSGSSSAIMSPVYQKFLDDVGDGPLTDDLLQCLAEELISLDERDVSTGPCEILGPSQEKPDTEHDPGSGKKELPQPDSSTAGCDSGLADDAITWTKGEVLGKGAYGIVYCGLTSHGQLVAVKQVSLDASDPDAAEGEYARLQGEVELLKTLRHANIVGFLGTSFHQQVVSIFMEYIPGGSIASILHRFGPLPERVLVLYTKQILEGVAYLHLNRVIHRDLKGNNIMLMPTGIIKLIDFGCARRLTCLSHNASNSADLLKSVHGTPYWMAPEVINDSGYGRKSDIWSVGCTVFEMATGKPPLAHMDKLAALFYIGAQRGVMPSLPDGFSETAKDFVQTCLICDQRLRPPAEHLLKHPFIHQNKTTVNTSRALKISCSGQTCS